MEYVRGHILTLSWLLLDCEKETESTLGLVSQSVLSHGVGGTEVSSAGSRTLVVAVVVVVTTASSSSSGSFTL